MSARVEAEVRLMKRISLEVARFKPFDGESYDGLACRLIEMVRAAESASPKPSPTGDQR